MPVIRKVAKKQPTKRKTKRQGVLDRIAPIGFDEYEGISINLYGRSGTGKTTLWATFPGSILAIIVSGGKRPGELRSINTAEYRKKVKQVVLDSTSEMKELIEYQETEDKFDTIVLDHVTGLQDLCLKEILGLGELPAQGSWGLATIQQWGQCTMQCKEILRALLGLSCNRVIVAQERVFNSDSESELVEPYIGAALTPSLAGWLGPACDYVCQMYIRQKRTEKKVKVNNKTKVITKKVKGVDFCLRTGVDPMYASKFRVPKGTPLPDCIVDPSYEKIKVLIDGAK